MQQRIVLDDLAQQPLLYFPAGFLDRSETHVEFSQPNPRTMTLHIVQAKAKVKTKRYRIVHHHGSSWVSLPKPWLRDQSAKPGDAVTVDWHVETKTATLTLTRKGHA